MFGLPVLKMLREWNECSSQINDSRHIFQSTVQLHACYTTQDLASAVVKSREESVHSCRAHSRRGSMHELGNHLKHPCFSEHPTLPPRGIPHCGVGKGAQTARPQSGHSANLCLHFDTVGAGLSGSSPSVPCSVASVLVPWWVMHSAHKMPVSCCSCHTLSWGFPIPFFSTPLLF